MNAQPKRIARCIVGLFLLLVVTPAPVVAAARGPLRAHPQNPRYFTDGTTNASGSLRAVYLTGAHTWDNLVDMSRAGSPSPFDFNRYLDFLERHHHNFIRLWAWDSTLWDTRANGRLGKDFVHEVAPLPWERTGPGAALDGKPKFDLTQFNAAYFDRLRERVRAASRRDVYVSVMLFEGWGLMHGNQGRAAPAGWAWRSHPFHPSNNANGVNASAGADTNRGRVHALGNDAVTRLQPAYIRKVVDTVNEFDNVLFEVINEGGEKEWDWWVVNTVREYERTKPKQHPIGITGHGAERLPSMLASPADWISPGSADGFRDDPPAWNTNKVSVLDTDHIWGVGGNVAWAWKSFLRGHNPIFMDPYDGLVLGKPGDASWEPLRRALGHTRRLAERVNLAALTPQSDLASTKYCLANRGAEYLVYQPRAGEAFSVELTAGQYRTEWFDVAKGLETGGAPIETAGGAPQFKAPFDGDAVLYLKREGANARGGAVGVPSWFAKAPPLPPPTGQILRVTTAAEFVSAVDRVPAGGTILLADGHYQVPRVAVLRGKTNVAIRSASGDPAKVVLMGKGWDGSEKNDDILHVGRCSGVTIADLTFADARSYGVKVEAENAPRDVHIYNCRFRDIGVRAIKGSAGKDPEVRAVGGSVRYCQFENTKVPPADWLFGGDYISAIDMMALEDWTFSDNFFRNIKGRNGGGRAAIFLWVRSRRVTVERNIIIDCDRGVAFGNPGQSTANRDGEVLAYMTHGTIRNNFIAGGADCGIELWHSKQTKVFHNTIWRPERNWARGLRVGTGTDAEVANNLVHGEIRLEGGQAQLRDNVTGRLDGYVVDSASGNLALTAAATRAIDAATLLPDVREDIRRALRSPKPDVGAWEFTRE